MLSFLKQLFTKDIIAKLLAILLAVGLWVFVISQETKIGLFPGEIPIQVKNPPPNFAAVLDVNTVDLKIVAPAYKWSKLSAESFTAYVDLEGFKEGASVAEIKVSTTDPTIRILEKTPSTINIKVDSIIEKNIDVKVKLEGKPATDNVVGTDIEASPTSVRVKGAKSIVENLLSVTAIVNINNENKTIEKNVKLMAFDAKNNPIQNLSFFPDWVKITVPIRSATNTKTVGIKPIIIGEVAKNYWVEKIITDPAVTTISGEEEKISQINYLETKPIDVTGITGGISNKVKLVLPEGVKLENENLEITVKVFVTSQSATKEVQANVSFSGISSNLVITNYSAKAISVVLSGDIEKINNLPPLLATFNLGSQGAGNASYNVTKEILNIPDNIDLVSSSPTKVEFKLEKK